MAEETSPEESVATAEIDEATAVTENIPEFSDWLSEAKESPA